MNKIVKDGAFLPIKQAKLFAYRLPLSKPINFNGQTLVHREGLILQLEDNKKQLSFGEMAPLPGFSHETLSAASKEIISLLNAGLDNLTKQQASLPSVRFAVECALQQIPLSSEAVKLDSVPLLQGDNNSVLAQYSALNKPSLIKLKVARQDVQSDLQLFKQLSQLNADISIRCDANRAWSMTQADQFLAQIDKRRLDYIEEPTASHKDNLHLAEKLQINLALDETLHNPSFNYQYHAGIKALVLKPTLMGSLKRLQSFIDIAVQQQLQLHISSSFESVIGLQQLAALANSYQKKCPLTLGIDTLKYFQPGLLTDKNRINSDLQQLECLWSSN